MSQVNLGGASGSFLISQFAGEVIAQFNQKASLFNSVRNVELPEGAISYTFPNLQLGTAKYLTPGNSVISTAGYTDANASIAGTKEKSIAMDKLLTCSLLINRLEEKMASYDSRIELANQLAQAVATKIDNQIFRALSIVPSKDQTGAVIGDSTGLDPNPTPPTPAADKDTNIAVAGVFTETTGTKLLACLYEAQSRLTARNVPEEDRYVILSPQVFRKILATNAGAMVAGLRPLSKMFMASNIGRIPFIAGFNVLVTNAFTMLPNVTTDNKIGTTVYNDYDNGDDNLYNGYSAKAGIESLAALCFHKSAVGVIRTRGIIIEANYNAEHQSDLLVAKLATGANALRYESAIAIVDTDLFTAGD